MARALLPAAAFVGIAVALAMAFLVAPTERTMGDVQRIFYFHVGAAWSGMIAFTLVLAASIAYLRGRRPWWDRLARAAAEVGVLLTTIVLLTGPLWARPVWGTWWTWDPRLTTTLIMWFIYVGYLLVRSAAEGGDRQARLAAVFGIAGYVNVPIVYVSTRIWRTIHPAISAADRAAMDRTMALALRVAAVAFLLLMALLIAVRMRLLRSREELEALRDEVRRRELPANGEMGG